jgi:hypothetical protein
MKHMAECQRLGAGRDYEEVPGGRFQEQRSSSVPWLTRVYTCVKIFGKACLLSGFLKTLVVSFFF